jgi:lipoprotein signal peptidase
MEEEKNQRSLDYAFKYFELHAKQRMTVFNFFLVIAGILTAGIAASLSKDSMPLLAAALSLVLILISIVFWKLDARTSFLIKHAETALTAGEVHLNESARLISTEPDDFEAHRNQKSFWARGTTYSVCFRIVFSAMIAIGVLGLLLSAARWSQLSNPDAEKASLWECVWLMKRVQGSTISVGRSNQCCSRSWVAFVTTI